MQIKITRRTLAHELAGLLINFVKSSQGELENSEEREFESLVEQFMLVRSMMLRARYAQEEVREVSAFVKNHILYFKVIRHSPSLPPTSVKENETNKLLVYFSRIKTLLAGAGEVRYV